jgi:hypothetical protein
MASNSTSAPGQIVGDMDQSNPPPSSYPPCTSKKQDRCTVMAQAKRHSKSSARSGA